MAAFRRRLLFGLATSDTSEVRALPLIASAARRRALRYVAGETLDDALAVARTLHARGVTPRLYVPYGRDWFRYWMRRVAESQGAG